MIHILSSGIDIIHRSPIYKEKYTMNLKGKRVELILDKKYGLNTVTFITQDKVTKGNDIDILTYKLPDDILIDIEKGKIDTLKYVVENFGNIPATLIREENNLYDENDHCVVKTITTFDKELNKCCEDHMYSYDGLGRVKSECISTYYKHPVKSKEKIYKIEKMIRILTRYDDCGNAFQSFIEIQKNGYFVFDFIKEVYIPATQPHINLLVTYEIANEKVNVIKTSRPYSSTVYTKYKVYNKNEFDFWFDESTDTISESINSSFTIEDKIIYVKLEKFHTCKFYLEELIDESSTTNYKLILQ